jgi:hypothetical protein
MSSIQVRPPAWRCAQVTAFSAHDASLVVDATGRIVRCSPCVTASLGWPAGALVGLPLSSVIADLPISVSTPGYNLAYTVFHATEGAWIRRDAQAVQGLKLPVEIAMSKVIVDGKPCIQLSLRRPLQAAQPGTLPAGVRPAPSARMSRPETIKKAWSSP